MRILIFTAAFCFVTSVSGQGQGGNLEGIYILVKGKSVMYNAAEEGITYLRGAVVIERAGKDTYAYYGALTPKGYTTVGRTGLYHFVDGKYISETPAGVPLSPGVDMNLHGDTLFVADKADNAVDSLVWKKVDKAYPVNKWLQKGIADSRHDFELLKDVK